MNVISSVGTFTTYRPLYPTSDDVIAKRWEREWSRNARWQIGRKTWVRIQQIKDGNGRYIYHPLTNIYDEAVILMGVPVDITEGDEFWIDDPDAATGRTERLQSLCRECHEPIPTSARFCIACGAPQE